MVLSNAERQARYRKNLKARAMGVTPADVIAATEVLYSYVCHVNAEQVDWPAFLARCRKRDNQHLYSNLWNDTPDDEVIGEINALGLDGELVRRVWPVAYAILRPPADTGDAATR